MFKAFILSTVILLLPALAVMSEVPAGTEQTDSVTYSDFFHWRWGNFSPQWRDTYELLLEVEMLAESDAFENVSVRSDDV